MLQQWSLQDAKNKFSEVVNAALGGKPQLVTRRGAPAVIILSAKAYEEMQRDERLNAPGFAQFLLSMPTASVPENANDQGQGNTLALREVEQ